MEIVSSSASSVAGRVKDSLFDAAGRQIGYLLHCDNNIEALRKEIQKLALARERLLKKVDAAEINCEEDIFLDFQIWIAEVEKIFTATQIFLEDEVNASKRCFKGWCINPRQLYQFSKEAKKQTVTISDQLREAGKFDDAISPPMGFSGTFESRELIKKKIMDALHDDSVRRIGICGMVGVGKTTLVKEIGEEAKEGKLYGAVMIVDMSKTPNVNNIKREIDNMLSLTLPDVSFRWQRMPYQHKETKRILIILDNVGRNFDLYRIRAFFWDYVDTKFVISTRSKSVCDIMYCEKIFKVGTLSKQESWELFKEVAGRDIENSNINQIAREIAAKCGGLPFAIVTVARALKNRKRLIWKAAAKQLRKSFPTNIGGMHHSVISSLKLCHSYLESEEAKSLFLFCSLFPEDFKIPVELLVRFGVGLSWFKYVCRIEDARDTAHNVVSILTSSLLLIDDHDDEYGKCVKMHDVIRDFAIIIAPEYKHKFMVESSTDSYKWPSRTKFDDHTGISNYNIWGIPNGLEFPKLQALLLQENYEILFVPDDFFVGMKDLKVLHLSQTTLLPLPNSLSSLAELRTLYFNYCKLDDLSVIGKLNNLEILSFHGSNIKEIPISFCQLSHLRLLDLNNCKQLEAIPQGVIPCFCKLEELYMIESFEHWDFEGKGDSRSNARLVELQALSRLTRLQIFIPDPNMLPPNNISFLFETLTNFIIIIGHGDSYYWDKSRYSRNMMLLHMNTSKIHEWIMKLLNKTENLYLGKLENSDYIFDNLGSDGLDELKFLLIESCEIKYLLNTIEWAPNFTFHNLEEWENYDTSNLVGTYHGQPPTQSFSKLESLYVRDCNSILNIVPSHLLQRLLNLKTFKTLKCKSLVYIFNLEGLEIANEETKMLSSLEDLVLVDLPKMTHIWKGDHQFISLCNLKRVTLKNCFKLMKLFSSDLLQSLICLENIEVERCYNLEEIFEQREAEEKEIAWNKDCTTTSPSLGKLTNIHISDCFNLKNLFAPSISVKRLVKLNSTTQEVPNKQIYYNHNMVDISHDQSPAQSFEKREADDKENGIMLRKKECNRMSPILGSLIKISIEGCYELKSIFTTSIVKTLVKLERLELYGCQTIQVVVGDEDGEKGGSTERMVFPRLFEMELGYLNNFTCFSSGLYEIEFPALEYLSIFRCPKLKTFDLRDQGTPRPNVNDIVQIYDNPNLFDMRHRQPLDQSFSKLKTLQVKGCKSMVHVIPSHLAQKLKELKNLEVRNCKLVVCIFELEGFEIANAETVKMLSSLKYLKLAHLTEMTQIWKGNHQFISLSNLETIRLTKCPKLLKLFSLALLPSLICFKELEIRRCNNLEEIFEKREAEDEEKRIGARRKDNTGSSPTASLGNLTSISIHDCGKLKYLFTFSIAKSLVNLYILKLYGCSTIQEIITNKEEEERASIERMVFPSLLQIELGDLNILTCFSSGFYTIEFPALERLLILNCPKMKTFCYGDQVTPKLKQVNVSPLDPNLQDLYWMSGSESEKRWNGNVNATVEQIFNEQEQKANLGGEETHDQITVIKTLNIDW